MIRPQLAESSKQMEGKVDTALRRPQFYDKFDPTTEFKMRALILMSNKLVLNLMTEGVRKKIYSLSRKV